MPRPPSRAAATKGPAFCAVGKPKHAASTAPPAGWPRPPGSPRPDCLGKKDQRATALPAAPGRKPEGPEGDRGPCRSFFASFRRAAARGGGRLLIPAKNSSSTTLWAFSLSSVAGGAASAIYAGRGKGPPSRAAEEKFATERSGPLSLRRLALPPPRISAPTPGIIASTSE